ncbi:MAG: hypothetical protein VX435_00875, partial [Planctomycetota bacterium]|nr:hypothetical protein [Planctomycetota bacterium]
KTRGKLAIGKKLTPNPTLQSQSLRELVGLWQALSPQQKDELVRLAQRLASTSTEEGESS